MSDAGFRFYVDISLEGGEDDLVADIGYRGDHIASAKRVSDEWVLTIYDHGGAGERHVPLDGMIRALQEASERLEQRS